MIKIKSLLLYHFIFILAVSVQAGEWKSISSLAEIEGRESIKVQVVGSSEHKQSMSYAMPKLTTEDMGAGAAGGNRHRLVLGNASRLNRAGEPVVPVVPCRLVLPFGQEIDRITVTPGPRAEMKGGYMVEHGQRAYPLLPGVVPEITPADKAIYGSDDVYPSKNYEVVGVQRKRGVSYVYINLFPVEYRPASGRLSYYPQMSVQVLTKDIVSGSAKVSKAFAPVGYRAGTAAALSGYADNPEALGGYVVPERKDNAAGGDLSPLASPPTLPCDPSVTVEYVIITSKAFRDATTTPNLWDLVDRKEDSGMTATIITMESIKSTSGYKGKDDAETLRNFIIDAYNNWNTDFILLAGDTGVVPLRKLWCGNAWGEEDNLPSDVYYQCLDGTYNSDGDSRWGEPNDGIGGGDVDLLSEVSVGRASAENEEEIANWVYKTLAYDKGGDDQTGVLMLGEHLGFGGASEYAKGSMEEIRLGSSAHGYTTVGFAANDAFKVDTMYALDSRWGKSQIMAAINSDKYSLMNHLGHCNTDYWAFLYNIDADALANSNNFIFVYSQGCIPGSFDRDCIAEHLTTSTRNGMFAVVFNSRYGWGAFKSTDGPSQRYNRPFWHAAFSEGKTQFGTMNAYAHEYNIYRIGEMCMRWCFYESNLQGDPAQQVRGISQAVTPVSDFISLGAPGTGPYMPSNKVYKVENISNAPESWSFWATNGAAWCVVSPSNATLDVGETVLVTVSIDHAVARTLPEGFYEDTIEFKNLTNKSGSTTRHVSLRIGDNYSLRSVPFKWVDPVALAHSEVGINGGASGPMNINFDFSLYGNKYRWLYISSRGYVTFINETLNEGENVDLPSTNYPNAAASLYWDDLVFVQGSRIYMGNATIDSKSYRVVTWMNMAHADSPDLRVSFQLLIRELPSEFDDNDLIYQYLDVDESHGYGAGRSATIGIDGVYGMFFQKYSFDGEVELSDGQALLFTMEPEPDFVLPTGVVFAVDGDAGGGKLSETNTAGSLIMEIRFNEIVTGLELSDLELGGNIPDASLSKLTGSGERYSVAIDGVDDHGFVTVGVKAGAVTDMSGNMNEYIGPGIYVVPLESPVFDDDLESGSGFWTASEGGYSEFTYDGWEYGAPSYWGGPFRAASGSNCWGTVLNGDYTNSMNGWIESSWVNVGDSPVLEYKVWYDTELSFDFGYVEVYDGSGWVNVTPGKGYTGWSPLWKNERIELNSADFGNRQIRVRFRLESDGSRQYAGMYVDDVRVFNKKGEGLWVYAYTPTNAVPESSSDVVFEIYNTDTQTYHNVSAGVDALSPGLSLSGTVQYGDVAPGTVVTGSVLTAGFGEAGLFNGPLAKFSHAVTTTEGILGEEYLTVEVSGVTSAAGTNMLTATTGGSVVDWTGAALRGDGQPGSSLFQVIFAGTNGVPDVPTVGGGVSGDDVLLFAMDNLTPYGLFGSGDSTPDDMGRFSQTFKHGLSSNDVVYVRAWNGSSYSTSIAYGDSDPVVLAGLAEESQDFGSWQVGTPINMELDLNGDTVPDGYDVINGRDATAPVEALDAGWTSVAIAGTGSGGSGEREMNRPGRVVASSNFVFVADTRNDRIQVWTPDLSNVVSTFTGSGEFVLNDPEGLALDETTNRLVVADTKNHRIVLLNLDPATGVLTAGSHFGEQGIGSVEFNSPCGVAVDKSGSIYVADTYNNRVHKLTPGGLTYGTFGEAGSGDGQFFQPRGVCVDDDGLIYVADGNHRVQIFDDTGTYVTNFGSQGSAVGEFSSPAGIQLGVNGRLVVADTGASRVQLFASNYVALAAYKPPSGEQGSAPGQLWQPQGVWPMPDGNRIYVADTWNHRVQLLEMVLDADGDGMNDAWEDANGLDSSDPTDGAGDPDGDGLSNVGEYRAGTDPSKRDTDGDFAGDLWEMQNSYDPLSFDYDGVFITGLDLSSDHVVRWTVVSGNVYKVEGSVNLSSPAWLPLTSVTSSFNGLQSWTNSPAPAEESYFYRVIKE